MRGTRRGMVLGALLTTCGAFVFAPMSRVSAAPSAVTVQTDMSDYQPNGKVIVTGFGWQANAPITLTFHEVLDNPLHPDVVISTFADPGGMIDTSRLNTPDDDFELDAHDVDVTYQLTATGFTALSVLASEQTTFLGHRAQFLSTPED